MGGVRATPFLTIAPTDAVKASTVAMATAPPILAERFWFTIFSLSTSTFMDDNGYNGREFNVLAGGSGQGTSNGGAV